MCGGCAGISPAGGQLLLVGLVVLSPVWVTGGAVYLVAKGGMYAGRRIRAAVGSHDKKGSTAGGECELIEAPPTDEIAAQQAVAVNADDANAIEAQTRRLIRSREAATEALGGDGALQEQIAGLVEAVRDDPSCGNHVALATALFLDGDCILAERHAKRAVELLGGGVGGDAAAAGAESVSLGEAWYLLGLIQMALNDFRTAAEAFTNSAHALEAAALRASPGATNSIIDKHEAMFNWGQARIMHSMYPYLHRADNTGQLVAPLPSGQVFCAVEKMEEAVAAALPRTDPDRLLKLGAAKYWRSLFGNSDAPQAKPSPVIERNVATAASHLFADAAAGFAAAAAVAGISARERQDQLSQAATAKMMQAQTQLLLNQDAVVDALIAEAKVFNPDMVVPEALELARAGSDDLAKRSALLAPWPIPKVYTGGAIGRHILGSFRPTHPTWCDYCGTFVSFSEAFHEILGCQLCNFVCHRSCEAMARSTGVCLSNVRYVPVVGDAVIVKHSGTPGMPNSAAPEKNAGGASVVEEVSLATGKAKVRSVAGGKLQDVEFERLAKYSDGSTQQPGEPTSAIARHHCTFHAVSLHKPTWCEACHKFIWNALDAKRCDTCNKVVHTACAASLDHGTTTA